MWLIIRKLDTAVVGTQQNIKPPEGAWNPDLFEIKEWHGRPVAIHDPDPALPDGGPVYSYDPTLEDPDYPAFLQSRIDFDALADKATAEIEWLNEMIPNIPAMTGVEIRNVVHRLAQENLRQIKAWRIHL